MFTFINCDSESGPAVPTASVEVAAVTEVIHMVDAETPVTATARDAEGNPVAGQKLVISADDAAFTCSPGTTVTTNAGGTATWNVTSTSSGDRTITVSAKGTSVADSATISFRSMMEGTITGGTLTQPNGQQIPTEAGCDSGEPTGLITLLAGQCVDAGVSNIGEPCESEDVCDDGQNSTCETTMWHAYGDNSCIPSQSSGINPRNAAATYNDSLRPVDDVTVKLMSRGTTTFSNVFGWYNQTSSKPDAADLHVIITGATAEGAEVTVDILNHPDYLGGEVGFFLGTPEDPLSLGDCGGADCVATIARISGGTGFLYYSESEYNDDYAGSSSYIHYLIYESLVWDYTVYMAWEDIYNGDNNDFTDMAVKVSGVGIPIYY